MTITKEILKAEIDKVPEQYFDIVYRVLQAFINPLGLISTPLRQSAGGVQTPEQVVARIQRLPKNPANIERATESLAEGLRTPFGEPDPEFDVKQWNQQWDEFESQMKADELAHEQSERYG